jgi:hypothetical protein
MSVVVVNLVTIAADLRAAAAGLGLLTDVDSRWLVALPGVALAGLLEAAGVRRLRSSGQRAEQGGRVVASPVDHAVDEQGGGA